ncbi:helix-turn-helix domain-containing protein [Saccharopolyspora phatthalungensis]|uniref:helix-turn-helix domain-containing protein n=1 Tax=Saccharopolyspora phatthalungensis TaxID=664693 RepID=UPI0035E43419
MGAILRAGREGAGVSLREMSDRVSMVAPYLSQIETGKRPVLPRHIKAYERALVRQQPFGF